MFCLRLCNLNIKRPAGADWPSLPRSVRHATFRCRLSSSLHIAGRCLCCVPQLQQSTSESMLSCQAAQSCCALSALSAH